MDHREPLKILNKRETWSGFHFIKFLLVAVRGWKEKESSEEIVEEFRPI